MAASDEEAARWARFAKRYKLPREAARALVLAVHNGADADSYTAEGRLHVFLHLPGEGLAEAILGEVLTRAGFRRDEEDGSWRFVR